MASRSGHLSPRPGARHGTTSGRGGRHGEPDHARGNNTSSAAQIEEFVAGFGMWLVRESSIVGEHTRMLTTYKGSFLGSSLVDLLLSRGLFTTRVDAVDFCTTLMEYGVFRHISRSRCVVRRCMRGAILMLTLLSVPTALCVCSTRFSDSMHSIYELCRVTHIVRMARSASTHGAGSSVPRDPSQQSSASDPSGAHPRRGETHRGAPVGGNASGLRSASVGDAAVASSAGATGAAAGVVAPLVRDSVLVSVVDSERQQDDNGAWFALYLVRVSSGAHQWVVKRRYKEFYNLHWTVSRDLPGTKLPHFPGPCCLSHRVLAAPLCWSPSDAWGWGVL